MKAFLRRIMAILLGLLVGAVLMTLCERLGSWLYPLPPGFNPQDPQAMAMLAKSLPMGALLLLLAGWFSGTAAGAWTALKIDPDSPRAGFVVGCLFFVGAVLNFVAIPHPAWFVALGLLSFWPATALGISLGEH